MFFASWLATRSSGAGLTSNFITAITALTCWPSKLLSVADRLWFLGPSTPSTIAELLAGSDLHIAPSRSYPVGCSLLEAMAAGCVVLVSDTAPHREVIVPGQTGLMGDGSDTDGLVRQALAVLDRPGRASTAGGRRVGDGVRALCPGCLSASACRAVFRAGCRREGQAVNVLFIHDAFPAQFGRLALELTKRHGWHCSFLVQSLSSCPTPSRRDA